MVGVTAKSISGKKKWIYKNIFSAPSSRPLIKTSDTTLESQEHGANSELSVVSIRGLEKFHFLYGDIIALKKVYPGSK